MDADSNRKFEEIRLEIDRLNERLRQTERSVAELFSQLARIRDRLGIDTEAEAT
jgi:predicted RNase H-like nuclease (RuvC/YqgF family)